MKATAEILIKRSVALYCLTAILSGCANSSSFNKPSDAGTRFQRAKRDFYSTNPLGRYYQSVAFTQVIPILNSNTDAQVAAQLNSSRGDYGDISGFFASLTPRQKQ